MQDGHTPDFAKPTRDSPKRLSYLYPTPTGGRLAAPKSPIQILSRDTAEEHLRTEKRHRLIRILIGVNTTLIVVLSILALPKLNSFSPAYIEHVVEGKPNYSVVFDKDAQQTSRNGRTFLEGKDLPGQRVLYVEVATSERIKDDCTSNVHQGGTTEIVSREQVNGEIHTLCYASSVNAYQANFRDSGKWYYVAVVPQERNIHVDVRSVKRIVQSVKVID